MPDPDLKSGAESLRALAASLAPGQTVRRALIEWWRHAPPTAQRDLRHMSGRISFGESPQRAFGRLTRLFGPHAPVIGALVTMACRVGCDPARLIGGIASEIETSRAATSHARSLVAGSILSARMVGALPLISLPLLPAAVGRAGALGMGAVLAGAVLCAIGAWWLSRLLPRADVGDPVALLADAVALGCEAGADLATAFEAIASTAPPAIGDELLRLRRLAHLGLGWPGAMVWSNDERLARLGRSLQTAARHGLESAPVLRAHSESLRSVLARRAEIAARRAPVAMILPLTLCLLPGFALILFVPFAGAVTHP